MTRRDLLKLLLCGAAIGPAIILSLQWTGAIYRMTEIEQGAVGIGAECFAVGIAFAWMLASDRREDRKGIPMTVGALPESDAPPYEPVLDAIRWIEDYRHGPSRPRTWRCCTGRCPHR